MMARKAARALSGQVDDEEVPAGNLLLAAVRRIFDADGAGRMPTAAIIDYLIAEPEEPWLDWRGGQPISPKQVANLLRPYGIKSEQWRDGGKVIRGYERRQLEDAWERWLSGTDPANPPEAVQTVQAVQPARLSGDSVTDPESVPDVPDVPDPQSGEVDEAEVERLFGLYTEPMELRS